MGKYLCVVVGLVCILVGIWGLSAWWPLFLGLLKAAVPPVLVLGGLIAVVAGVTEIRDTAALQQQAAAKSAK